MPWRDRHGRLLPIKAVVLALAFVPGLVNTYWWVAGELGGRPLTEMIHATGLWSVRFMLIALAITPFARMFDWSRLLLVRRMVGLTAMAYAILHLVLYFADQKFKLLFVASEIVLRFYLTIGFVALLGLVALGVTSTDNAVRRLGRRWKQLHRLVYLIAVLGILHYFIQTKANVSEPVFVAGLYVWLMLWRPLPEAWKRRVATYAALAIVTGLATVGLEFAWYGIATSIDPWRVLLANQSIDFGLRPAHWAFVVAVAVAVLVPLRRLAIRRAPMRGGIVAARERPIPRATGTADGSTQSRSPTSIPRAT
jgi:sulfoxide reductase heme-binding subunit YedZ